MILYRNSATLYSKNLGGSMKEEKRQKLWEEYSKYKTKELRDEIIIEYAGLVKIVAGRISMYLGNNVEYDDLIGNGIFGLIDAIDKFDISKGVKFETYASLRIRGSILDQIRKMDWVPRSVRQKQKKIDRTYQRLESKLGPNVEDEELAKELDISIEELDAWQSQTELTNLVSLDEYIDQGSSESRVKSVNESNTIQPESSVERQELKKILVETLNVLTEREKKVIVLYYYEDLTLKEISYIMEVSESRISQLHRKALQKMKDNLGNNINVFLDY